jgi:hypothetical protein
MLRPGCGGFFIGMMLAPTPRAVLRLNDFGCFPPSTPGMSKKSF